jgi:hypothetical protein
VGLPVQIGLAFNSVVVTSLAILHTDSYIQVDICCDPIVLDKRMEWLALRLVRDGAEVAGVERGLFLDIKVKGPG